MYGWNQDSYILCLFTQPCHAHNIANNFYKTKRYGAKSRPNTQRQIPSFSLEALLTGTNAKAV
jgi:hypothetical protein